MDSNLAAYAAYEAERRRQAEQQQQNQPNLVDVLGKLALGAGAVAAGAYGVRRGLRRVAPDIVQTAAETPVQAVNVRVEAPVQTANVRRSTADLRRIAATVRPPGDIPREVLRQQQLNEITRQARAERPQGVVQTNLDELTKQFFARGKEPAPVSGALTKFTPSPNQFLDEAVQKVSTDVLNKPGTPLLEGRGATAEELAAGQRLLEDPEMLALVKQQQQEERSEALSFQSKAQAEYRNLLSEKVDDVLAGLRSEQNSAQAAAQNDFAQQYLNQQHYIEPSMVVQQQSDIPEVVEHSVNAINSAQDQETARAARVAAHDVLGVRDLGQVNARADQLEQQIESVAQRSNVAPPVDAAMTQAVQESTGESLVDQSEGIIQTSTSAQRFLQRERDEIASELGEQGFLPTQSRIEQELNNRLGKSAYQYGPKYTARRQALELYAQTGNPVLLNRTQRFGLSPVKFETFENMPVEKRSGFETAPPFSTAYYPSEQLFAEGLTSNVNINVPTLGRMSTAEMRVPVINEQTAAAAEEYVTTQKEKALNWLSNLQSELQPKKDEILNQRRSIAEQTAKEMLPRLEAARQANDSVTVKELETNLENLRRFYRQPELGSHREDELRLINAQLKGAENKINESIRGLQKKYPTTIFNWSGEAPRVYGEADINTGELIPGSVEVRGERRMLITQPKGGGGRNLAEYTAGEALDEEIRAIQGGGRIRDYDETGAAYSPWRGDNTQTGRKIDIYGIRPSAEKRANPEVRPSLPQYKQQEIIDEALRLSHADPYGDVPIPPETETAIMSLGTKPKRSRGQVAASQRAFDVSRKLRQLQLTGKPGEAETFLDAFKKGLI